MILLPICTEPSSFVKERHICYFVSRDGNSISLEEVVERCYRHPEAPNDAFIPVTETRVVKTLNVLDNEAGVLLLMEANQKAILHQEKRKRMEKKNEDGS